MYLFNYIIVSDNIKYKDPILFSEIKKMHAYHTSYYYYYDYYYYYSISISLNKYWTNDVSMWHTGTCEKLFSLNNCPIKYCKGAGLFCIIYMYE